MRTHLVAAVALLVVALTGCAGDGDSSSDDPAPQESETSATPSPRSEDVPVVESEACEEVRAGIDAFNLGEFDATIEHFEKALPLAEEQDDGSEPASQLVEAVRYYAELDAELYPDASRTSPEFAKYKAITLGQCVAGAEETSEPPGQEI